VEVIKSNLGVQISSLVKKCDTWIVYPNISQSNTSDCPFSPVIMDNFCDYPSHYQTLAMENPNLHVFFPRKHIKTSVLEDFPATPLAFSGSTG